jgi:hypothetical protein
MALPKKRKKDINIKRVDPQGGPKHWVDQFKKQNKTFLPRSVDHADLDKGFIEFVGEQMPLTVSGDKVPIHFMSTQRWAEFSKTYLYILCLHRDGQNLLKHGEILTSMIM